MPSGDVFSAVDLCYRIAPTSHSLHMQAHLCHRTLLLCDLTRRSLGFHQPVVTVQASWFPPTVFTSFDGNMSWLSEWKTMMEKKEMSYRKPVC